MKTETRIITAALPFVNNIPHLGNIIGSHLPADIFARFCRLKNYRTIFVGGTDEHGTAIEFAAQIQKKTPEQLCIELYQEHKEIYDWFKISYDNFSRTSRTIHHELVKDFFLKLYKNGFITEKTIKIPFCLKCQRGLADRYITGTCPHCNYEHANGDQCEKCATLIDPIELIDSHCSVCKSKEVEFRDIKHLFLDLRSIAGEIEEWIDNNKNLRQQVRNLAKGWLKQGIQERCITRDLKWGVQVPLEEYKDKVFYVWFDNVIGYISATYELLGEEALELWKDKNVKTYYFLGKDNIPFHTIFWPGQIIGQKEFVLPYNVVGYQYLNFEGQKFSKSKKIGIFSDQVKNSNIPLDYWRFYLTNILPETKDTDFSVEDFQERINKELIGNFGNFVNRTLNFIFNKFDGKVFEIFNIDKELEKEISQRIKKIEECYEKCDLREVLQEILKLSDLGNQYFNKKEPWKTNDKDCLAYCYELCRILSLLFSPIIPDSSEKLKILLNTDNKELEINRREKTINKPEILFKKLENEDLEEFKLNTKKSP
ncbi:methionine--tRNA ligase [Candidatus Woesearchaeota archaeon]|jgi:methionyl-tRNA synthetase|nr:methionine--tRNA ligase [Candidatus Woesearchaeota archaeon]MBT5739630.1 methionine--tRNA ligase [Candidatus Woesearchaeota archaeon]